MSQEEENFSAKEIPDLVEVNPRDLWKDEAGDFTPWLRDNIARLRSVSGISFAEVTSEEYVGTYNADIWAKKEEGGSGRGIFIENGSSIGKEQLR